MNYEEPVPDKEIHHGCLCCGGTSKIASLDTPVFMDDGTITRDGITVYPTDADWDAAKTPEERYGAQKPLRDFEEMAKQTPDADWKFHFVKALRDGVYQRQGEDKWVLIKSGQGYA